MLGQFSLLGPYLFTAGRLFDRSRQRLARLAHKFKIPLRQSYARLGPRALKKASSHAHAGQFKRAPKETKQLKTYLGRVYRDAIGDKINALLCGAGHHIRIILRRLRGTLLILLCFNFLELLIEKVTEPRVKKTSHNRFLRLWENGVKQGKVLTTTANCPR